MLYKNSHFAAKCSMSSQCSSVIASIVYEQCELLKVVQVVKYVTKVKGVFNHTYVL